MCVCVFAIGIEGKTETERERHRGLQIEEIIQWRLADSRIGDLHRIVCLHFINTNLRAEFQLILAI